MISVKWGEMMATRGYKKNEQSCGGIRPPPKHVVKRGNPFDPSCATVPLAPTCPKKKGEKVRVLGMCCGHLDSASELNFK